MRIIHADWVVSGEPNFDPVRGGALAIGADGTVHSVSNSVSELKRAFPEAHVSAHRGVLLPGLVNAYARTEHALVSGRVPGGKGWVDFHREVTSRFSPFSALDEDDAPIRRALAAMHAAGTIAVGDVTSSGATYAALSRSQLSSRVFREIVGVHSETAQLVESFAIEQHENAPPELRISFSPASLLATHPETARALGAASQARAERMSLSLLAHAAERSFLTSRTGPFATLLQSLGLPPLDWRMEPSAPLDHALALELVGPHTLLAHLTDASTPELERIAQSGAHAVVTPRAALHVEVRLPPVDRMLAAGLTPALGTDSPLASGTFDVLEEAACLRARFPTIAPRTLLAMATSFGARALDMPSKGALVEGRAPGVLLIEGTCDNEPEAWVLSDTRRPRTWLA